MKVLHQDLKKGVLKVQPLHAEDVWTLSTVIAPEDTLVGVTERKIKIQDKSGETIRVVKKTVTLTLSAKKTSFVDGTTLRISGTIISGPEDIPKGSHHTLSVEAHDTITIQKAGWPRFLLDKIRESTAEKQGALLLVIFDREEALFVKIAQQQPQTLLYLKGDVTKKDREGGNENFFSRIATSISTVVEREEPGHIVIASPSFWNDYVKKELSKDILSKAVFASVSQVGPTAVQEVLKRPELQEVLARERTAKEANIVEELLQHVAEDKAFYGLQEAEHAITIGNAAHVLVTEGFLKQCMEQGTFGHLQGLLQTAEKTKGTIHILSSPEAQQRINALGGIAGTTRWQQH